MASSALSITDQEAHIQAALQQGDQAVIRLIYEAYGRVLLQVIYRIVKEESLAQDVFQETLVKIWQKGHLYERERGSIYTWLVSVCRNAAIDKTRSRAYKKAHQTTSTDHAMQQAAGSQGGNLEQRGHVHEMVQQLPDHQRQLIEMAFFQGYTHEEIAKAVHLPLGTVKGRIRSAIKRLRNVMEL
ncbi:MAG: sigma-70 family RNA polymerase sigma factor [Bacteroidota bacterium]